MTQAERISLTLHELPFIDPLRAKLLSTLGFFAPTLSPTSFHFAEDDALR
jgi:hypothetical protein